MKKIVAIIEKGEDGGYSIYAANDLPLFASGMTEQEAKDEFCNFVQEQGKNRRISCMVQRWWSRNRVSLRYVRILPCLSVYQCFRTRQKYWN